MFFLVFKHSKEEHRETLESGITYTLMKFMALIHVCLPSMGIA